MACPTLSVMEPPAADVVRVELVRYDGSIAQDDPHAGFKRAVSESSRSDPMPTFTQLAALTGVPVGALVRYALVRWAAEGSEALLALGPRTVERLWDVVADAEAAGTDAARLDAYERLRQMLSWLRAPLEADDG